MPPPSFPLGHRLAAALVLTAATFAAAPAEAYCRTANCDGAARAVCVPAAVSDCGVPLFWASPCVSYSLQKDASVQVSLEDASAVFEEAFATWMDAECAEGGTPRVRVVATEPVACARHEYNKDRGNANVIVFRDASWPHQPGQLALTTASFDVETGEIYDADMEINSADATFSIDGEGGAYDLLTVVTHEAGHFLGLAHTKVPTDATMFEDYHDGGASLEADDRAGICAVYPPGEAIPAECDATPRHGFSPLCGEDQPAPEEEESASEAEGCACAAAGAPGEGRAGVVALLGGLAAYRRRRSAITR